MTGRNFYGIIHNISSPSHIFCSFQRGFWPILESLHMPYLPIISLPCFLSQTKLSRHITILLFRRSVKLSPTGRNMSSAAHVLSPKIINVNPLYSSFGYSYLSNSRHIKSNILARIRQDLRFHEIELKEAIRRRFSSMLYSDVDLELIRK